MTVALEPARPVSVTLPETSPRSRPSGPSDGAKPILVTLTMLDNNTNGKVDRVTAVFSETLAASTATAPWTLANTPSGARSERRGRHDDRNADAHRGCGRGEHRRRQLHGRAGYECHRDPRRRRQPVELRSNVAARRGGAGTDHDRDLGPRYDRWNDAGRRRARDHVQRGDPGVERPGTTTITETDPKGGGNDTLTITSLTNGARALGANNYVNVNNTSASFGASTLGVAGATVPRPWPAPAREPAAPISPRARARSPSPRPRRSPTPPATPQQARSRRRRPSACSSPDAPNSGDEARRPASSRTRPRWFTFAEHKWAMSTGGTRDAGHVHGGGGGWAANCAPAPKSPSDAGRRSPVPSNP